jgi:hypothetical protein
MKIRPVVLELKYADRQTDRHDQLYMCYFKLYFSVMLWIKLNK